MNYLELFDKIRSEYSSNVQSVTAKDITSFLKNPEKVGAELTQKEIKIKLHSLVCFKPKYAVSCRRVKYAECL